MAGPIEMPEAYPHGLTTLSPKTTIVDAIRRLGPNFKEVPLQVSNYIKPASVLYDFDGKERRWDIVESHASVGVVLYHRDLDAFLLVRQFRPAVYATVLREAAATGQPKPPLLEGFTCELCAGLIDKAKSNPEICQEEIAEECGFEVPLSNIKEISVALSAVGTQGAKHIIYYAEVDKSMQRNQGGGLASHGECIEVLALPFDRTEEFVVDSSVGKSPGAMFGLMWAMHQLTMGKLGGRKGAGAMMNDALTLRSVLPA